MPIQLGTKGQADFTEPFDLLMDCHRRIENFLDVLDRVVEQFGQKALNDEARRALAAALDYFAFAAPKHTADEEESLFPRLSALHDDVLKEVIEHAAILEQDHRQAEVMHGRVERIGRRWLTDGDLNKTDLNTMREDVRTLKELYIQHIAFEDKTLFPAAASALDAASQSSMGKEMARRRGLG